ncbi:hypothetical protein J2J97_32310 (plasmid) [Rhizobium bangladeshense]|uniref:hypothetical protein n=1 Tax=Rhizobium bangladeshense TaxID=1138189 RepID=UPI001A98C57B|nr:hypothetical protein [Rhizobium bangladeshense]QSY98589.1 hypothetical protein J2J97_32310 [Rhizobium bangladeshense]
MTHIIAVMIIYFGAGKYSQFDSARYDSVNECLAARAAIIRQYEGAWSGPSSSEIVCIPVEVREDK